MIRSSRPTFVRVANSSSQRAGLTLVCAAAFSSIASAQLPTFGSAFVGAYSVRDLGAPGNVPTNLGGVTFLDGELDTLLIGGAAASVQGAIYRAPIQRDASGHVQSFAGPQVLHSTSPNIDGGLGYGPSQVLFYASFPSNTLGQIRPGSNVPDKIISLTPLGVTASLGGLVFVPQGFAGGGRLKLVSYATGQWWDTTLTPDGAGTFNLSPVTPASAATAGGPEGAVYVAAGNPGFAFDSVLLSEYLTGRVSAYEIDAAGNPIVATRRDFLTGLSNVIGAATDPLTGDFIFSTYGGGNRVLAVSGFGLPSVYCSPKASSNGCVPDITYAGQPTLTGADDFEIRGTSLANRRNAILLWSLSPASLPFAGGTLCLSAPTKRGPISNTGGSPITTSDCSGALTAHLSQAFMQTQPWAAGTSVYVQLAIRDPGFSDPETLSLSAGLRFTLEN